MEALFNQIPELAHYRPHIAMIYETKAAINRVRPDVSKIHPLAPNGKSENVMAELFGAVLDFLAQAGQTKNNFLHRFLPLGGDGLTYQKILELKRYL
ncbi:MAG: hypothetical protein NXY57DRAFT_465823 [Lentinula lateritia]|nr:MAG: hypothetical protein NXY57DRAFT_465823 [Lentinula lateritia]